MPAKITFKTSKEHTERLMFEHFKKTSIPRIIKEHQEQRQKSG